MEAAETSKTTKHEQSNGVERAATSSATAPTDEYMAVQEGSDRRRRRSKGKAKAESSSAAMADMGARKSSKRKKHRSKDKKAASCSSEAAAVIAEPFGRWPELHEELLGAVLGLLPSLCDVSAVASVCRPWRAFVRSSRPVVGRPPILVRPILRSVDPFPNRRRRGVRNNRWIIPRRLELLCPAEGAWAPPRRSMVTAEVLAHKFLGVSHGHIIFVSEVEHCVIVVDPFTGVEIRPPPLSRENISFNLAILTLPISSPDCKLILSANSSVFFLWGVGDENWSIHSLRAVDVMDSGISIFWDIIMFKDQIYAFDYESRLFSLSFSPELSIKQLPVGWEGGGPSASMINGSQFLVECGGELMVVQPTPLEAFVFWTFNVYRLEMTEPPMWKKVHDLGDASLFVDSRSAVACECPGLWGGRSNCIYYIGRGCDTWYVYPLDGGTLINAIDPNGPFHHTKAELPLWPSALWIYPSTLQSRNVAVVQSEEGSSG